MPKHGEMLAGGIVGHQLALSQEKSISKREKDQGENSPPGRSSTPPTQPVSQPRAPCPACVRPGRSAEPWAGPGEGMANSPPLLLSAGPMVSSTAWPPAATHTWDSTTAHESVAMVSG